MIQPKFDIGQTVYVARVSWRESFIPCPDCLGQKTWFVRAPSGEEWAVDCLTCQRGWYSTGQVGSWSDQVVVEKRTIGSVRVDTADRERPVSYMCVETGVGTGSVYDERNVFASRDEAEVWGTAELARVAGLRQAEEFEKLKRKKRGTVHKRSKK